MCSDLLQARIQGTTLRRPVHGLLVHQGPNRPTFVSLGAKELLRGMAAGPGSASFGIAATAASSTLEEAGENAGCWARDCRHRALTWK